MSSSSSEEEEPATFHDDNSLPQSKLSQEQLQTAKIISQCLSPISCRESESLSRDTPSLLTTRTILTEKIAYGLIFLDQRLVLTYSMSTQMKLKIDGSIDTPRGMIHHDIISLKEFIHHRCHRIFSGPHLDHMIQKIISDTFEYHLATLQRHEMNIYLMMNAAVLNRRAASKTIPQCVMMIREYINNIPVTTKLDSIAQMPLVIPGSTENDAYPLRRRLSQPI
ncbi:Hypothetical protein POVR1_LOCUS117 [uncultured virus]|nr:Hypothetical protein POVR1_LOCUS117 [uncultured virus]